MRRLTKQLNDEDNSRGPTKLEDNGKLMMDKQAADLPTFHSTKLNKEMQEENNEKGNNQGSPNNQWKCHCYSSSYNKLSIWQVLHTAESCIHQARFNTSQTWWSCYLFRSGIWQRLTWKPHIAHAEGKARRKLTSMRKLAGTSWVANEQIPKIIYRGTVRPYLENAGQLQPRQINEPFTIPRTRLCA